MNFEKKINILSDKKKVWDHLTIFDKAQRWNECLLENQQISTGEIRSGYKSKNLIKEGKKSIWYDEEIVEFLPHDKLTLQIYGKSLGKNPMISSYQLSVNGDEVSLCQRIDWKPSGVMLKLLHGIIRKMSEKNIEKDLTKLKKYLEKE